VYYTIFIQKTPLKQRKYEKCISWLPFMPAMQYQGLSTKISRGATEKSRLKNSTIKPSYTLSVSCMKIQGATAADAHKLYTFF